MPDRFQKAIDRARILIEEQHSAKVLLSWNHQTESFEVHDLTYKHNTQDYFAKPALDPLCFIIAAHLQPLKDPALVQRIAQDWYYIIHNISNPPALTSILLGSTLTNEEADG